LCVLLCEKEEKNDIESHAVGSSFSAEQPFCLLSLDYIKKPRKIIRSIVHVSLLLGVNLLAILKPFNEHHVRTTDINFNKTSFPCWGSVQLKRDSQLSSLSFAFPLESSFILRTQNKKVMKNFLFPATLCHNFAGKERAVISRTTAFIVFGR
jgi:hypothetical protein